MSGISKPLALSLLAQKASATALQAVAETVDQKADASGVVLKAPEYFVVLPLAGQSNMEDFGEGMPLVKSHGCPDAPNSRVYELGRYYGINLAPRTAYHCLDQVSDMRSRPRHPNAATDGTEDGSIGPGFHIAKKLLAYLPSNVGVLLVPCARGGSVLSNTSGTIGTYDATEKRASKNSTRWNSTSPLYKDLKDRVLHALSLSPKNVLLPVVWAQGEFNLTTAALAAEHKTRFDEIRTQFAADINESAYRAQVPGMDATKLPWVCGDTPHHWRETYPTEFATVYGGSYMNRGAEGIYFIPYAYYPDGTKVETNAVAEDPNITSISYYGSAARTSANWLSSTRQSHFASSANRGILAERLAAAVARYGGRHISIMSNPVSEMADTLQSAIFSNGNVVLTLIDPLTQTKTVRTIGVPTPVINYAPAILTVGYNSRRGDGTLKSQGFLGSLEYAANTPAIAGATVIDGAAANNPNTLTSAIAHPDGLGGFTYRHSVSATGSLEWRKSATVSTAELAKLITFGGAANIRARVTSAYAAQFMAAMVAMVHKTNALLPASALTGILGTDNAKVSFLCHCIQGKAVSAVNSLCISTWQNGGNVDLVSIPFDNAYHDYRLAFAGSGVALVTPSIDSVVGAPRALHYSGSGLTVAAGDTTTAFQITDITTNVTLGFNLDTLQFVIYQDNGNITLANTDADHAVTLQRYARNHTITIPDFAIGAGKSIYITAENTGNVVVQGANSNVLIQPLDGATPLPTPVTIARAAGDARATYKFTQISADGKTWVRTA